MRTYPSGGRTVNNWCVGRRRRGRYRTEWGRANQHHDGSFCCVVARIIHY
ncbi:hypothetical protein KCP73_06600 [Salmonella enterica subsp. enterica]|nr:hypothetical protein KCP73_06600 [Salmonella enterica subsp. enterica]